MRIYKEMLGIKMSMVYKKIEFIEKELKNLKTLVLKEKKKTVSLRGMGKLLVSNEELDKAVEDAKKALSGAPNVLSRYPCIDMVYR